MSPEEISEIVKENEKVNSTIHSGNMKLKKRRFQSAPQQKTANKLRII